MQLNFENLPLREVVVRLSFDPPLALGWKTLPSLAAKLNAYFPEVEDVNEIETPPGIPLVLSSLNTPGIRFQGSGLGIRLLVQPQVLSARWQFNAATNDKPYPRYAALRGAVDLGLRCLIESLVESGAALPKVVVANLLYINMVDPEADQLSITSYFAPQFSMELATSAPVLHEQKISYRDDLGYDIAVAVARHETEVEDGTKTEYRLATAAGARLQEEGDPILALDALHSRLQQVFASVISAEAKTTWGFSSVGGASDE